VLQTIIYKTDLARHGWPVDGSARDAFAIYAHVIFDLSDQNLPIIRGLVKDVFRPLVLAVMPGLDAK
jgi:hypothetical protein